MVGIIIQGIVTESTTVWRPSVSTTAETEPQQLQYPPVTGKVGIQVREGASTLVAGVVKKQSTQAQK
jgi:alpha-ketoglutarate-dependent taurine dioxygenase